MPKLVLGPLLRYVGETEATVWVETDSACEVELLGHTAATFRIGTHHYAIVAITGLEPGSVNEYEVALDGERNWPPAKDDGGFPPSTIRTIDPDGRLTVVFGSCRVAVPHEPPYDLSKDEDERGREVDALYALAHRMRSRPRDEWPDLLLLLGDQVYVDEDAPQTREFIRGRRDTREPPYEEVADFEEYTRLYWETWGGTVLRWLLSTVSTAMIFDDHDVHDDWNTSRAWLEEMNAKPWWHERITGALMSYWTYQHLGNLSPAELAEDELLAGLLAADDGEPILREFAVDADGHRNGSRWSYARKLGGTKLVVFDSREGRELEEGNRRMFDEGEWEWIERETSGDHDHLLLADTLPVLLSPAMHDGEAWNEAVCAGAWGRLGKWAAGERLRRAVDLEHWAAFRVGFERLARYVTALASGAHGEPPATIVLLGGDVHHAYLAEVGLPRAAAGAAGPGAGAEAGAGAGARSAVYQAVCSPFRNPLDHHERRLARLGNSRLVTALTRLLARSAGVPAPPIRWRLVQPATFDNQFATLELEGRSASFRIEKTIPGRAPEPRIETSLERRLDHDV